MNAVSGLSIQGHWYEGQYLRKYNTTLITTALFTNLHIFSSLQTYVKLYS